MKNGKDGCSDGPGPHLSPYFNDAKMVRFALRGPSLLPWRGWELIVPIYFVQDYPMTTLALQKSYYAIDQLMRNKIGDCSVDSISLDVKFEVVFRGRPFSS